MYGANSNEKDESLKGRLLYILSVMTIEPMMFVQGVATGISQIASDQMLVYKICRGLIIITIAC